MFKIVYVNLLSSNYLNKIICIYGLINNIRNHGGITFIDLKDKTGILQIVFKIINNKFIKFLKVNDCIFVKGFLVFRNCLFFNFFSKTGNIELYCYDLFLVSNSYEFNFNINNYYLSNFIKLFNRHIYLRGNFMQNNIKFRYNFIKYIRNFLNKEFFIDIETPFLSKDTPEGSKNFLIPSRLNYCKFYVLPQSPQVFKQILMISFFDRYYQIVKCFRDEDFRRNRQFEFTQLDCEVSFVSKYDIIYFFSNMILFLFFYFLNYFIPDIFFINYNECKKKFFTDKPDLRINIYHYNFNTFLKFKYFFNILPFKILILNLLKSYDLFGNNFKNFSFFIKKNLFLNIFFIYKKKYLNFHFSDFFLKKNIKIFTFDFKNYLNIKNNINFVYFFYFCQDFINLFISYLYSISFSIFGFINNFLIYNFLPIWVFDFPFFNYDFFYKKYDYSHNPFSSPINFDNLYLDFFPTKVFSKSYDLIINGVEIGGGSIRNNRFYIQKRIFFILNSPFWELKFSFFFKSLTTSVPFHGGIALGIDRFLMLFLSPDSIKEVIAFPKTQRGFCLFTNSPDYTSKINIDSLNISCLKNNFNAG